MRAYETVHGVSTPVTVYELQPMQEPYVLVDHNSGRRIGPPGSGFESGELNSLAGVHLSRSFQSPMGQNVKLRRLWILGWLAFLVLPSWAVRRHTVEQLEQTLISANAARKTDLEVAHEVGQIELSERISAATFARLNKLIEKDPHAVLALQLLADASSFLPLPANELPSIPAPDQPTQQRQLEATRKYAFGMIPRLPNLLATRTTYSFDDSPQELEKGGWFERGGFHLVGTSKAEASVVDEGKTDR